MKRHEMVEVLSALKSLDPRGFVTIDDTTINIWTITMNRAPAVSLGDAIMTVQELVATPGATFPTPGDFRALVAETVSGVPSLADARRQVERTLKENYPGMPAKYTPDAIVLAALRQIGGAAVFRASQSEQQTNTLWRQFDAAYRRLRDEQVTAPAFPDASTPALKESN